MGKPADSFTDLEVWQKAHKLVLAVYRLTQGFPKHELYGVTSQLRRATVSIPANIAEGFRRKGKRDKARLINIAHSSLEECRYYLFLSEDLKYADCRSLAELTVEISKMLLVYERKILSSKPPG